MSQDTEPAKLSCPPAPESVATALFRHHPNNRPFDLPPSWDGQPVTWGPWSELDSTLAYHLSAEALACRKCGAVAERSTAWGVRPPASATVLAEVPRHTRTGRAYLSHERVPARPVRDLFAARCRHCGHDTVSDERTGEVWELEPEDYSAEGSRASETLF